MDENAVEPIKVAVSVFIVLVVISLAFLLSKSGSKLLKVVASRITGTVDEIESYDLKKYDCTIVKGSDVISCIKNYAGDGVTVVVHLKKSNSGTEIPIDVSYSTNDGFSNLPMIQSQPNQKYINPNAEFTGSISKNSNGVITSVVFQQNKCVDDAVYVVAGNNGSVSGGTTTTVPSGDFTAITDALRSLQSSIAVLQRTVEQQAASGGGGNGGSSSSDDSLTKEDLQGLLSALIGTPKDGSDADEDHPTLYSLQEAIDALDGSTGDDSDDSDSSSSSDVEAKLDEIETLLNSIIGNVDDDENVVSLKALSDAIDRIINGSVDDDNVSLKELQEEIQKILGDDTSISGDKSLTGLSKMLEELSKKLDALDASVNGDGSEGSESVKSSIEELQSTVNVIQQELSKMTGTE